MKKKLLLQSLDLNLNAKESTLYENQEIFSEIYLFFMQNITSDNSKILLIKWLFTNVHKYNIKLQDLNERVLKNISQIISRHFEIFKTDFSLS